MVSTTSPMEVAHFRLERTDPKKPYELDYKPMPKKCTTLMAVVNYCRNNDDCPDLTAGKVLSRLFAASLP